MTDFDHPASHGRANSAGSKIRLGERFVIPSRPRLRRCCTFPRPQASDTHPIHYDVEYCRARGMPDLLAHGFRDAGPYHAGRRAVSPLSSRNRSSDSSNSRTSS